METSSVCSKICETLLTPEWFYNEFWSQISSSPLPLNITLATLSPTAPSPWRFSRLTTRDMITIWISRHYMNWWNRGYFWSSLRPWRHSATGVPLLCSIMRMRWWLLAAANYGGGWLPTSNRPQPTDNHVAAIERRTIEFSAFIFQQIIINCYMTWHE